MANEIDIPVFDMSGARVGSERIDEALLGGTVRVQLLKQAIVAHESARRQGTFKSKTRAEVEGSSRKLYRQKGTGNARAGNVRTPVRRGGGHAFAKTPRQFDQPLPRRMRLAARNSAILAKMKAGKTLIIDSLRFDAPKTKRFAGMLKSVGARGACLVALAERDENVWRSGRNIQGVQVLPFAQVNAYHVLRPRQVIFSREAFDRLKSDCRKTGGGSESAASGPAGGRA
jgi:large subunit ribosomal protein L4